MKETWQAIKDYEGLYEISNIGRLKSLEKEWIAGMGKKRHKKETIMKLFLGTNGYLITRIYNGDMRKTVKLHQLVWDVFGNKSRNGTKLQVDHIDNNKQNNRIDNLQLLTNRQNMSKYYKSKKNSSKYTGVCWAKAKNRWVAQIKINNKTKTLGYFKNEIDASAAYQNKLIELEEK